MRRIIVIGSSGAGKSTFARRLGAATGIEVIHLDVLYWLPGWTEPAKNEWSAAVARALEGDAWIIDGNFGGTMEMRLAACDTAILLDLPRAVCVYRILKRWLTYRRGTRPDMAAGCDEKFDWQFVKWVWRFPFDTLPRVEERLERLGKGKTIIRLKSRREVEDFFVNLQVNQLKSR